MLKLKAFPAWRFLGRRCAATGGGRGRAVQSLRLRRRWPREAQRLEPLGRGGVRRRIEAGTSSKH